MLEPATPALTAEEVKSLRAHIMSGLTKRWSTKAASSQDPAELRAQMRKELDTWLSEDHIPADFGDACIAEFLSLHGTSPRMEHAIKTIAEDSKKGKTYNPDGSERREVAPMPDWVAVAPRSARAQDPGTPAPIVAIDDSPLRQRVEHIANGVRINVISETDPPAVDAPLAPPVATKEPAEEQEPPPPQQQITGDTVKINEEPMVVTAPAAAAAAEEEGKREKESQAQPTQGADHEDPMTVKFTCTECRKTGDDSASWTAPCKHRFCNDCYGSACRICDEGAPAPIKEEKKQTTEDVAMEEPADAKPPAVERTKPRKSSAPKKNKGDARANELLEADGEEEDECEGEEKEEEEVSGDDENEDDIPEGESIDSDEEIVYEWRNAWLSLYVLIMKMVHKGNIENTLPFIEKEDDERFTQKEFCVTLVEHAKKIKIITNALADACIKSLKGNEPTDAEFVTHLYVLGIFSEDSTGKFVAELREKKLIKEDADEAKVYKVTKADEKEEEEEDDDDFEARKPVAKENKKVPVFTVKSAPASVGKRQTTAKTLKRVAEELRKEPGDAKEEEEEDDDYAYSDREEVKDERKDAQDDDSGEPEDDDSGEAPQEGDSEAPAKRARLDKNKLIREALVPDYAAIQRETEEGKPTKMSKDAQKTKKRSREEKPGNKQSKKPVEKPAEKRVSFVRSPYTFDQVHDMIKILRAEGFTELSAQMRARPKHDAAVRMFDDIIGLGTLGSIDRRVGALAPLVKAFEERMAKSTERTNPLRLYMLAILRKPSALWMSEHESGGDFHCHFTGRSLKGERYCLIQCEGMAPITAQRAIACLLAGYNIAVHARHFLIEDQSYDADRVASMWIQSYNLLASATRSKK